MNQSPADMDCKASSGFGVETWQAQSVDWFMSLLPGGWNAWKFSFFELHTQMSPDNWTGMFDYMDPNNNIFKKP